MADRHTSRPTARYVDLTGRVLVARTPTVVHQNEELHAVADLGVSTTTGVVRVALWNEQASHAREYTRGTSVRVVGRWRTHEELPRVDVGPHEVIAECDAEDPTGPSFTPVANLTPGSWAHLRGQISAPETGVGPTGPYTRTTLRDDTGGVVRLLLWDEYASLSLTAGDTLEVYGTRITPTRTSDRLSAHAGSASLVVSLGSDIQGSRSQPAAGTPDETDREENTSAPDLSLSDTDSSLPEKRRELMRTVNRKHL